ncbi:YbjN domain-containing protein [Hyphomicrobiales bacterium]|jgi:hypothetical protein|nr:hypothetical protein [Rhodobiaceae bacterium]MBT5640715.1 hypothetical protein [Rhodobiaceae bacterium]MBT6223441.1 hypothetical protein [Rhodobiaceae bacterium]MDC0139247.1 YbjN domain-containing protein [Hyphomicrobiales bacterium]|tara:strand:+ start:788 stop:1288 length:501 start_codon:yes stop_codon:yes gene_type:complete
MKLLEESFDRILHPIDIIEDIASVQSLPFNRTADDEISMSVSGKWCNYEINFNWHDDLEGLHLACIFDAKIPKHRLEEVFRLTAKINELQWFGHFDIWSREPKLLFRYSLLLSGGVNPSIEQCKAMMQHVIKASEKYYPSFQYVIWGGNTAEQAIENALFETVGES